MPQFFPAYLVTLVLLAAIDFVWLAFVARGFYVAQLGELMRPQPDLLAAALFYAVYAAGITQFATLPAVRGGGWGTALVQGAMLGLVAYATYDLSNLATLKGWPVAMTVVDIAWGTVLTALVAALASTLTGWLTRS
jgi:uncharacterized membrane protein